MRKRLHLTETIPMDFNNKPAQQLDETFDRLALLRARLEACPNPAQVAAFLAAQERALPGITRILGQPIDGMQLLDWIAGDSD